MFSLDARGTANLVGQGVQTESSFGVIFVTFDLSNFFKWLFGWGGDYGDGTTVGLMHRCTADGCYECGSLLSRTIVEGNYMNDDRAYAAMTFLPALGFFFVSQKSCSGVFANVLLFLIGS